MNQVFNVALGERTSLNALFRLIRDRLAIRRPSLKKSKPVYAEFRRGDIRHSQADIGKARRLLGYSPTHRIANGLDASLDWYLGNVRG